MRRGRALAVPLVVALFASSASAAPRPGSPDLHDARYCEVLELRGAIPDAEVLVWNTIGLNDCPEAEWAALDAAALAAERGDTIVIKNGPRHFLMDSATAEIGRRHTFGGIAMRKVATIPIHSSAELVRSTYTERTIERHNTWTWEKGRRVYELLAPDGSNYVMQSYAQITDPEQSIAGLRSLGERLTLPKGWSYRSRRLKRDLTLVAHGSATVIQDDFQNTYQRLPRAPREPHQLQVTGATKSVGSPGPGMIEDRGSVSGEPFGDGTVDVVVTFGEGNTATGTFEIDAARGSAFGTIAMTYVISGSEITFTGTASFSGGTGEFRGIKGTVDAYDHNTLDGQSGSVKLDGRVRY
ncbi:MAG TPA: hypothetical protein VID76_10130 [Solirubrobacterales bacterium]